MPGTLFYMPRAYYCTTIYSTVVPCSARSSLAHAVIRTNDAVVSIDFDSGVRYEFEGQGQHSVCPYAK